MTEETNPRAVIGANRPPVEPPTDTAALDDLRTRYPEVAKQLVDIEAALKSFPPVLETEEQAKALTDVLGQASKMKSVCKAYRGVEKGRWNKIVSVVQNFFGGAEDKSDEWHQTYKPRLQKWSDDAQAAAQKAAQAELERQQVEAERLRAEHAESERQIAYARRRQEEAEQRENEARERAEVAERERVAAEQRAEVARAEEERVAREKREREKAEKEGNVNAWRVARTLMREAEKLNATEDEKASDDETPPDPRLDEIVRAGGLVGAEVGKMVVAHFDEKERAELEAVRARLGELRKDVASRLDVKERRKRARIAKQEEEAAALRAARFEQERQAYAGQLAEARRQREEQEALAATAKAEAKEAKAEAKEHRQAGDAAYRDEKGATREAKGLETQADRAANRAGRIEKRLEDGMADAGRVRGDLGTMGVGTGRWAYEILDDKALRTTLGELGPHFTDDALGGAVYRWMEAHREGFNGERVEGLLPGVVFVWDRGIAIRT